MLLGDTHPSEAVALACVVADRQPTPELQLLIDAYSSITVPPQCRPCTFFMYSLRTNVSVLGVAVEHERGKITTHPVGQP